MNFFKLISIKKILRYIYLIFIIVLLSNNNLFATNEFDPEAVNLLENIKKNNVNTLTPYVWGGTNYLEWSGLKWSDDTPRQLLEIDLTEEGVNADRNQTGFLEGNISISGVTGLKKIRIKAPKANFISINNCPDLESLDMARSNVPLSLNGLDTLENLQVLKLDMNWQKEGKILGDINQIKALKHLKELSISPLSTFNLKILESLKELESFSFRSSGFNIIYGLENIKTLKKLNLGKNYITKIQGLDSLNNLKELYLDDNKIRKFEGLENLNSLELLDLSDNEFRKLDGIEKLPKSIKDLNLYSSYINSTIGIDSLVNLEELNLAKNRISELKNFKNLVNLRKLKLYDNPLKKIDGIESLKKLEELDIKNYSDTVCFTDEDNDENNCMSHLSQLDSLKKLNVSTENLNGLEKLFRLEELTLTPKSLKKRNSKIIGLSNLNSLSNLKTLTILGLGSRDVAELKYLPNISSLTLDIDSYQNKVEVIDLNSLTHLKNLEHLELKGYNLNYVGLENLTSLKTVKLQIYSSNTLPDLSPLHNLEQLHISIYKIDKNNYDNFVSSLSNSLQSLHLNNIKLDKLLSLSHLSNLTRLELLNCSIFGAIDFKYWPNLKWVDLRRNSITDLINYELLPNSTVVDISFNHLPLSALFKLIKDSRNTGRQWRFLEYQWNVFGEKFLNVSDIYDLSSEVEFDGKKTKFEVTQYDGEDAPKIDLEYCFDKNQPGLIDIGNGLFRANCPGRYWITMTNDKIRYGHLKWAFQTSRNLVRVQTSTITVK